MSEDNNDFTFAPIKLEPYSPNSKLIMPNDLPIAVPFALSQKSSELKTLQEATFTSTQPPAQPSLESVGETKQSIINPLLVKVEGEVMNEPMAPKLENIVSTVNFDCELDLRQIALHAKNAEYNPKRFAAVIMRIRTPKTTALVFHSGKMVCTGAKSEADSETAARKYAKTIKKLGFNVKFKEFKIQNIVASASANFLVNLEVLRNQHQKFCTYDPEIFPGLIYRMVQPKIVLLLFSSGKVVLTGAKKREELIEAFNKIYPTLCCCRKKQCLLTTFEHL